MKTLPTTTQFHAGDVEEAIDANVAGPQSGCALGNFFEVVTPAGRCAARRDRQLTVPSAP